MDLNNYDDYDNIDKVIEQLLIENEKAMSLRDDGDYEVNQEQADKFTKACLYFQNLTDPEFGEFVEAFVDAPKTQHGNIIVHLCSMGIGGQKEMAEFSEILSYSSSFGIHPTTKGEVMLSLLIPYVFVKKQK